MQGLNEILIWPDLWILKVIWKERYFVTTGNFIKSDQFSCVWQLNIFIGSYNVRFKLKVHSKWAFTSNDDFQLVVFCKLLELHFPCESNTDFTLAQ